MTITIITEQITHNVNLILYNNKLVRTLGNHNGTDGQTDGQTECDAICDPLLGRRAT